VKYFLFQKCMASIALAIGALVAMSMGLWQTVDVRAQQPQESGSSPIRKDGRKEVRPLDIDPIYPNVSKRENNMLGLASEFPGLPAGVVPGPDYFGYPIAGNDGPGYPKMTGVAPSKQPEVPLQGTLREELNKYMAIGFVNTWTGRKMICFVFEVEGTKIESAVADEGETITVANASAGLESVLAQLVAMHKQTESVAKKQEYKKLATQVTGYLFQIQQQKRNTELLALENRIAKLKASSLKREQMSQQIIANRVDELLGLTEGMAWSE
jgi:hypothetical protein